MSIYERLDVIVPSPCGFDATSLGPVEELRQSFKAVPERCRNCPTLNLLGEVALADVMGYAVIYHAAEHQLTTDATEQMQDAQLIESLLKDYMSSVLDEEASITPGRILQIIRQQHGEILEFARNESTESIAAFNATINTCSGSFKMRATKAGKQYTTTICNSTYATDIFGEEKPDVLASFEIKHLD